MVIIVPAAHTMYDGNVFGFFAVFGFDLAGLQHLLKLNRSHDIGQFSITMQVYRAWIKRL